jgi:hypothetical protein
MKKTIALPMLALLLGCGAHKHQALPEGNMPMTEQEYLEAQLLIKKQILPPDKRAE